MYQQINPYTGFSTVNIGPSETSNLGLGQGADVTFAGQLGVVAYHSPTPGSPGTSSIPVRRTGVKAGMRGLSAAQQLWAMEKRSKALGRLSRGSWRVRGLRGIGDTYGGDSTGTNVSLSNTGFPTGQTTTSGLPTSIDGEPVTYVNGIPYLPSGEAVDLLDLPAPGGLTTTTSGATGNSLGVEDPSQLINTVLADANNIAKIVLTPGGSYTITNPLTGQVTTYQGTGAGSTGIPGSLTSLVSGASSLLPILLLAGGAIFVFHMAENSGGKH